MEMQSVYHPAFDATRLSAGPIVVRNFRRLAATGKPAT
jgi:hypothetical protein